MAPPVAFQLTKTSCVALGSFNIYIIQPRWLTEVGILQESSPFVIEANMERPGFKISSPEMRTVWFVSPGKLAIESQAAGPDPGEQMTAVLAKLPFTPIYGLGNNVIYRSAISDLEPFPAFSACEHLAVVPGGYRKNRHAFGISLEREGRNFNLNMTVEPEWVELTGNAHMELRDGGNAEQASGAAKRFSEDIATFRELFAETFGVRFIHDNVTR